LALSLSLPGSNTWRRWRPYVNTGTIRCCRQAVRYSNNAIYSALSSIFRLLFPRASHFQKMPHDSMSISSHSTGTSASSVDVDNFICPKLRPPSPGIECGPLPISNDHDGQPESHPVQSPTPQRGYILPYAYGPQGSRSSQDIGTLTVKGRNSDATSLLSLDPATLPLASAMSLPLSHMWNSLQPESYISQPMKVSRTPTPASVSTAPPGYFSPGCPPPLRTVVPISAASVQRWNRKIVVYIRHIYALLR
jgi:hypothetical protein